MKKLLSFLCICLCSIAIHAEVRTGTCGDNLTWSYDSETKALTITGSGAMRDYSNDLAVPWHHVRSNILSVSLPEGLTSIGDCAFWDCSSLTSITLPDGVTSIGNMAFVRCYSLTSVAIPESVTSIGNYAFSGCGITNIRFHENLTSIGSYILQDCPLEYITALKEAPVSIRDNLIGRDKSTQNIPLFVSPSSVSQYKSATYWKDYDVKSQGFGIHTITTQATASVSAVYIAFDSIGHDRLGYVFAGDTIWNNDASSDSVSFTIAGLAPSIDYEFCLVADSVFRDERAAVVSDPCDGSQWSEWSTSFNEWVSDSEYYYTSGSYDNLDRTIILEAGVEYTFSVDAWRLTSGSHLKMYLVNEGQHTDLLNVPRGSLATSATTYVATFTPIETKEYTLRLNGGYVYVNDISVTSPLWKVGSYSQCVLFRTQPTNLNANTNNTTQTTVSLHLTHDFGDAGVDSLVCKVVHDTDTLSYGFYPQEPQGEIDTVLTHLQPNTNYKVLVYTIKNNTIVGTSISTTFKTLPIVLDTPSVSEYGQTYVVVNSDHDYGDATLIRNVLEFKLSLANAIADTTIHITDAQTKITNLLPDTTYYYRHILEVEGDTLIMPASPKVYDFENAEDNTHWHFINGTQRNQWIIDASAGSSNDGSNALYISYDGASYSYSSTTSTVWAYCEDVLCGEVTISFDWKGTFNSSYEHMNVYLIPVSADQPTDGSGSVPTDAIRICSLYGQSSWTTFTDETRFLTEPYRLYFNWSNIYNRNAGGGGNPIAIDNVIMPGWQEFSTKAIALTTQPADGISNTSSLLHGTVDCDQESYTEVGFEWKRSDAPATVQPQRLLVTDRVDENLLFRLEGLSSDRWYDFRTFCSYLGETYYGEWQSFVTTDKEVLVAPTVQTVGAEITEQGVEMEGFVVAGTEPMLQQGFEVWVKGTTNVLTTVAEGTIMHAFIPEVRSYTTYQYRAYAKTAAGTTYGATLEIETGYIKQNVQDVTVTPSATEATITWTVVEDAAYYLLTLFADEAQTDTIGVYEVGTDGVITRRNKPGTVQSLVNCLVEELEPDTEYFFSVVAYNAADQKVAEETGWFATELPTSLVFTTDEETDASAPIVRKILYNGQVLILRDGKVYNLFGQEVR